jgi:hypothetical protein
MEIDEVVDRVQEAMAGLRHGSVLAIWSDGSITEHRFGFWGERLPNGSRRVPLATFARSVHLPLPSDIAAKLRRGLERHSQAVRDPVA